MGIYGDRALELQKEGFSCAQSVVACLCERYGVDRVTALRFAGVFGSGIGLEHRDVRGNNGGDDADRAKIWKKISGRP